MLAVIAALEDVSGRSLEVVHAPRRKGDQPRSLADTTRIREALGWEPTTPFERGLEAQWRWAADRVASR
jgi:UDP-glucose 4-epimerase